MTNLDYFQFGARGDKFLTGQGLNMISGEDWDL